MTASAFAPARSAATSSWAAAAASPSRARTAVGVLLGGDIGGAFVIQGAVTTTGYRSTIVRRRRLEARCRRSAAGRFGGRRRRQRRAAAFCSTRGRPTTARPTPTRMTTASPTPTRPRLTITTYGVGPRNGDRLVAHRTSRSARCLHRAPATALSSRATSWATALYSGVSGTGLSIGGAGHTVNIAGGMTVTGAIRAQANGASATALHIGGGATVPQIVDRRHDQRRWRRDRQRDGAGNPHRKRCDRELDRQQRYDRRNSRGRQAERRRRSSTSREHSRSSRTAARSAVADGG